MTTKKQVGLFLLLALIIGITACKKNGQIASEIQKSKPEFTVAAAKEWYNTTFTNSPEFKRPKTGEGSKKSYKEPNWNYSIYKKVGNTEIIELPLIVSTKSISIPSTANLSLEDKKRIVASSLTKVTFIKKGSEITIRETDYIPELDYLKQKSFNIPHVSLFDVNSDFTGIAVIKEWSGAVISFKILKNGKITGTGKYIPSKNSTNIGGNRTSSLECLQTFCWFTYDCDQDGDGIIEAWEECILIDIHDCFIVNVCPEEVEACENLTSEECLCAFYGICNPCTLTEAEAQAILSNTTYTDENTVQTISGAEYTDPITGRMFKPHGKDWKFITINQKLNANPEFTAKFAGVVYKDNPNDTWKWSTFTFDEFVHTGGNVFLCTEIIPSGTASIAIGDISAPVQLSATFNIKMTCLIGTTYLPDVINRTRYKTFYSND